MYSFIFILFFFIGGHPGGEDGGNCLCQHLQT